MNKFNSYIISLVFMFIGTFIIIIKWIIPHFTESYSNKMSVILFILSMGLLSFHFLRYKVKKMKSLNILNGGGYKVKLVKDIHADSPKTVEKSFVIPFLPMKNMYIINGMEREFVSNLEYDVNSEVITLITLEDNRCVADDLKMREVLSEYISNGWKVSK